MNLGASKVEPGTNQSITFETHPESTIAIRGVDQSLLILSQDKSVNDISPAEVPFNPFYHSYDDSSSTTSADAYSDFEDSNLMLLTNSNKTEGRSRRHVSVRSAAGDARHRPIISNYIYYDGAIRTRSNFPETWLWNELLATDFTTVHSKKIPVVPDTITSWYVTALSLNAKSGLAVTETPTLLNVFRPFFITLNLPYSVTQGESFELQVLIHNYLNDTVQTRVTFYTDDNDIRFVDSRERGMKNISRLVSVKKATVGLVSFVIMPINSGEIPLHLDAVADVAGDAIVQRLRVEVPGIRDWKQIKSKLYDGYNTTHTDKYTIKRTRTKRSSNVQHKLTVSGYPLADSTAVLDGHGDITKLVQLPKHCSEQAMILFVPNILALDWFRANGKENPVLEAKLKEHLRVGYLIQMKSRRPDGAFLYWPQYNQDVTWLTSYILRCFNAARKYIKIDDTVMLTGLKFLRGQQNSETGQFMGTGAPGFHYTQLAGSRNSSTSRGTNYGLTAYVTLTMIEIISDMGTELGLSKADSIKFDMAKNRGLSYISSESSLMDSDLYNLILVTTTLAAANHDSRYSFYDKMMKAAKSNNDKTLKWWEMGPEATPSTLSIEMTGYALQAQLWMSQDKASDSIPIVRWLLKQKTEGGAFRTTQDSVVALTALSKFAERTVGSQDDSVAISVMNKNKVIGNVTLDRANRDAPIEFLLPKYLSENEFTVSLKGRGKAYVQYAEVKYNENIVNTTNYYDISATLTKDNENGKQDMYDLEFCLQLRNRSHDASEQVVAVIKLPTGFMFEREVSDLVTPVEDRTKDTVARIERMDQGTTTVIYYSHLNFPKQCLELPVYMYIKSSIKYVGNIKVTDYYNPDSEDVSTIFPDTIMTVCDLCLKTGSCDVISGCI